MTTDPAHFELEASIAARSIPQAKIRSELVALGRALDRRWSVVNAGRARLLTRALEILHP